MESSGQVRPTGSHPTLRDHLLVALDRAEPDLGPSLEHDPAAYLRLVSLARDAQAETAELLDVAVTAARSAGCTWEQIGEVLGTTRQAVHKRYGQAGGGPAVPTDTGPGNPDPAGRVQAEPGPPAAGPEDGLPRREVLRGLTAFNEMAVLARAGRYGWRSVDYGPLFHVVERDTRQWEHRRTTGSVPEGEGWQPVGRGWSWWTYWARPLSVPPLPGDPTPGELVRG